jgi:hypothetical protein
MCLELKGYIDVALELRPNCEFCDKDLPPASMGARICTYELSYPLIFQASQFSVLEDGRQADWPVAAGPNRRLAARFPRRGTG